MPSFEHVIEHRHQFALGKEGINLYLQYRILLAIKAISVKSPMTTPLKIRKGTLPLNKLSFACRGFSFITSGSSGSTPSDNAGSVSVIKFTHKM